MLSGPNLAITEVQRRGGSDRQGRSTQYKYMDDPSLVSVVPLACNQGLLGKYLRKRVRQNASRSASVRRDCHSVSHSAVRVP